MKNIIGKLHARWKNAGLRGLAKSIRGYFETILDRRIEREMIGPIRAHFQYIRYLLRYKNAAPKPWDVIHVDPAKVDYMYVPPFFDERRLGIRVGTVICSGDWDENITGSVPDVFPANYDVATGIYPFEKYDLYTSAREYLIEGKDWESTDRHRYILESEQAVSESHKRKEKIYETYKSIDKKGYISQESLKESYPEEYSSKYFTRPQYGEVCVSITSNGEIIFEDGRHRFIASKLLELDRIPVRVVIRHKEWQKIRQKVAQSDNLSDLSPELLNYVDHPDLRDIVPES